MLIVHNLLHLWKKGQRINLTVERQSRQERGLSVYSFSYNAKLDLRTKTPALVCAAYVYIYVDYFVHSGGETVAAILAGFLMDRRTVVWVNTTTIGHIHSTFHTRSITVGEKLFHPSISRFNTANVMFGTVIIDAYRKEEIIGKEITWRIVGLCVENYDFF